MSSARVDRSRTRAPAPPRGATSMTLQDTLRHGRIQTGWSDGLPSSPDNPQTPPIPPRGPITPLPGLGSGTHARYHMPAPQSRSENQNLRSWSGNRGAWSGNERRPARSGNRGAWSGNERRPAGSDNPRAGPRISRGLPTASENAGSAVRSPHVGRPLRPA